MTRHGQYGDAAGMVLGAVEANPKDSEAWVALGNNLVGHAEGTLTPAAMHAFRKAAEADPASPAPGYFLGLALITNGKVAEGRAIWVDLVTNAPSDAPWREELTDGGSNGSIKSWRCSKLSDLRQFWTCLSGSARRNACAD
jgi:cytochrome c-type biogenesis protein CcmH